MELLIVLPLIQCGCVEEGRHRVERNTARSLLRSTGAQFYTIRLRENGTEMTNKYDMMMYDCSRGTNRVESVHKDLIAIVRGWHAGVEMSVALLGERRHRHNQKVAEIRRLGYPKISQYDIWLIEESQFLY